MLGTTENIAPKQGFQQLEGGKTLKRDYFFMTTNNRLFCCKHCFLLPICLHLFTQLNSAWSAHIYQAWSITKASEVSSIYILRVTLILPVQAGESEGCEDTCFFTYVEHLSILKHHIILVVSDNHNIYLVPPILKHLTK